jgi:hypothetical protein
LDEQDGGVAHGERGQSTQVGSEWQGWSDRLAHPDSPAGGGGPGHFARLPLGQSDGDLPSPWQPRPTTAVPLQGSPTPTKANDAPVTVATKLGVLKHVQDDVFDVHIEAEVLGDDHGGPTKGAHTSFKGVKYTTPSATTSGKKIVSFTSKFVWRGTIFIQTAYSASADPNHVSCYGRGTTAEDVAARNISLGFHESCHRQDYAKYLAANKLPDPPKLVVGMTVAEFNKVNAAFEASVNAYFDKMEKESVANTDEVGHRRSTYLSNNKCFKHAVP